MTRESEEDLLKLAFEDIQNLIKERSNLIMLVKRLSYSLRRARPESKLPDQAMKFLSEGRLIGICDVLRSESGLPESARQPMFYDEK